MSDAFASIMEMTGFVRLSRRMRPVEAGVAARRVEDDRYDIEG
jgi:hypothetical protein